MGEITWNPMTRVEAVACCDAIRAGIVNVKERVVELYERFGWKVLGYKTFEQCCQYEFPEQQKELINQLEPSQRAAMAVTKKRHLAPIARQKQIADGSKGGRGHKRKNLCTDSDEGLDSLREAADSYGVSRGLVAQAERVAEQDPGLFDEMLAGKVTANAATTELAIRNGKPAPAKDPRRCFRPASDPAVYVKWMRTAYEAGDVSIEHLCAVRDAIAELITDIRAEITA